MESAGQVNFVLTGTNSNFQGDSMEGNDTGGKWGKGGVDDRVEYASYVAM